MAGWLSRLLGSRRADADPGRDPFIAAQDRAPSEVDAFADLLEEVERAALAVYARHGLPTAQGHYRRAPGAMDWAFIAETLTPEQKFALSADHPREAGWRFGSRDDLGAVHRETPELVQASGALAGCAWLRARRGVAASEALASALKLGALWRDMVQHEALLPDTTLTLRPVDTPRQTRKKAALPSPSPTPDPEP
ncbi:hypothetical protein E4M02_02320 [Brevundimonas sp. S30B]|uniref:hypothetical protein n=1 Tax=unclassified Brevundimonas TaxID=2622653 RepID=UPI0010729AD7|nr:MULTISPECIES: hypothetical protein [unclassified Brevundimonas]QBX37274.1 hypothetical protein E4M01_05500 [Brevundimonas sp. MF30-B]TFW03933.1 hypothetical protein E4M02_02320 [Brevundimonas sp. S30B]